MKEVKVVLYGVEAVGSLIAKSLLEKRGIKIVGLLTMEELLIPISREPKI